MNKLWGNNFIVQPKQNIIDFTSGNDVKIAVPADYHLLPYDIWVNKVHCLMLGKQNIITKENMIVILTGLQEIEQLIQDKHYLLDPQKEDVHTNIESWLIEHYGMDKVGMLHTARSRNDQSNTDTRLFLRDQVLLFVKQIIDLNETLLSLAGKYKATVIPGFTHYQHAMVTTFGHILLSFTAMLNRDLKRFTHWYTLHNLNPLGNSAGYGTSFPIDQFYTALLFAFDEPENNSLDTITNRWEAEADLAFAIFNFMNHLSLISQTLIVFSTPEFGMIKLNDLYSTGSSIMPQKKNPDSLEVIKGKTAFIAGLMTGLLQQGTANFIGYNRDSQWTKYAIIQIVDECKTAPGIMKGLLATMKLDKKTMEKWCHIGFIGTTILLEQLIANYHLPFRKAKSIVEKAIAYSPNSQQVTCAALKKALVENNINVSITAKKINEFQQPKLMIKLITSFGSPGKEAMKISLKLLKKQLLNYNKWLTDKKNKKDKALQLLHSFIAKNTIINNFVQKE